MNVVRKSKDGRLIEFIINGIVQPIDSGKFPSVATQAKGFAVAAGKALLNPKPVSKEEREQRLAICNACEFLIDGKRCAKCGCHVNWKSRLEAWHCPIDKW